MDLSTIFPSKYLKAADLKGREPTVVIATAAIEKIGDDNKLILYFQGKDKGIVCNRTNADRIAYMYGTDTDGWIGKEIVLYTEMVNFQGKVTEGIRVKPPVKRNGNAVTAQASPPRFPPGGAQAGVNNLSNMPASKPKSQLDDDMDGDSIPF